MRGADADQPTVTRFCNRRTPLRMRFSLALGEQWSSYGTRSITALMESASLWKVDVIKAGPRAVLGLERLP